MVLPRRGDLARIIRNHPGLFVFPKTEDCVVTLVLNTEGAERR